MQGTMTTEPMGSGHKVEKFDHRPDRAERERASKARRQDRRNSRRKAVRVRREDQRRTEDQMARRYGVEAD
jgi:hypothetical protein